MAPPRVNVPGTTTEERALLLVAWAFPPHAATGVHVPTSLARYSAEAGWDVRVACGPAPDRPTGGGLELLAAVPPSVRLLRVPRWAADSERVRWTASRLPLPDIDGTYLAAVALAASAWPRLRRRRPRVVLATGPRFANFVAGRWLAEGLGARLVLHYRDEWTVNTPPFIQATADDRLHERRALARADLVVFVSDAKRAIYREAFPELDPARLVVVPNGWDPHFHERAGRATSHLAALQGRFTLTFSGRWHASLAPLLASLEAVLARRPALAGEIAVVFVGNQIAENVALFASFAERWPGVLHARPAVPPAAAVEIQRESDALLLVNDHLYGGVMPLKTFDYLNGDRPILVFGTTGGAADLVVRLGAGIAVGVADPDGLEAGIDRLRRQPASSWGTSARRSWAAAHDRRRLTGDLLERMAVL